MRQFIESVDFLDLITKHSDDIYEDFLDKTLGLISPVDLETLKRLHLKEISRRLSGIRISKLVIILDTISLKENSLTIKENLENLREESRDVYPSFDLFLDLLSTKCENNSFVTIDEVEEKKFFFLGLLSKKKEALA